MKSDLLGDLCKILRRIGLELGRLANKCQQQYFRYCWKNCSSFLKNIPVIPARIFAKVI